MKQWLKMWIYEKYVGKNRVSNWQFFSDNLIWKPRQFYSSRDRILQTGTVPVRPVQLECLKLVPSTVRKNHCSTVLFHSFSIFGCGHIVADFFHDVFNKSVRCKLTPSSKKSKLVYMFWNKFIMSQTINLWIFSANENTDNTGRMD